MNQSAPNCSDTGSGSSAQPFCTVSAAVAKVAAGQTVQVASGTYRELVRITKSGTSTAPIVVESVPGAAVTITGGTNGFRLDRASWVTVRGFNITGTTDNGVYLYYDSHVTISGNHVTYSGKPVSGSTAEGVYLKGTTDSLVSDNTVDHNSDSGIYVTTGTTRVEIRGNTSFANARGYTRAATGIDVRAAGNTVDRNVTYGNEDTGVQVYSGAANTVVVDNLSYGNGDHGIDVLNSSGAVIVGNTVYSNKTAGINVEGSSSGATVMNNISADNGLTSSTTRGNIRVDAKSVSGTTLDYDLVYLSATGTTITWGSTQYSSLATFAAATGQESHGLQGNPRWSSPGAGDFHLTAGSPAIDSAQSAAPGQTSTDIQGNPRVDDPATANSGAGSRPYDDRGAYEFQPGTPSDLAPSPRLSASPSSGTVPLAVTADASASTDTDATPIASYAFDFGDGTTTGPQTSATATHTYTSAGTYTVTVTVTDTAGLAATATASVSATGGGSTAVDEVHYTFTSATSVAFDWRGTPNDVRYGPTSAYGSTVTGTTPNPLPFSSAGPFWEAEITGLAPNTTYHYSIGGSSDATFRTAPTGNFRFDAEGDIGDSTTYDQVAPTQAQIASDNPALVLVVGDLTYGDSHGQAVVDQHFNDVMTWSRTAAYMPTWGNHEWNHPTSDDLRNYKGRFDIPNGAASPGAPTAGCCGEDWGWFDAGGVRFISYPEPYTSATWTDWTTKADQIMAAAQADSGISYIVTFGHRPAYSTGHTSGNSTLAAILNGFGDKYSKYVLNLNGDSHDYERFLPSHGVVHITSAGGGAVLEPPWEYTDPNTAYRAMHLAHVRVDVSSSGLHVEAVCGPATSNDDITCTQGSVIDSVTIPPRNGGTDAPPAALLSVSPSSGAVPLAVTADASASTDTDATPIASYNFDFGDGTTSGPQTSPSAAHTYSAAGTYTVKVTVTDTAGLSATATSVVTVTGGGGTAVDEVHYSLLDATSVAFDWRGTSNEVRYGTTSAYGSTATGTTPSPLPFSSAGPYWEADITGLAPNTTYHYSIGGSSDATFRTAPTGNFRFDAEGDVGDSTSYSGVAPNQALIAADNAALVLVVGDLTYGNDHGQAVVDQHFNDVMTWSRTAAYMPAWGNHEWDNATYDDLRNYKGRFDISNGAASPGAPSLGCCGEDWGWFDAGGVRFISYPEPYTSATWTDWNTKADQLMAAAQADPSIRYIVTFGHRPAYSTGHHSGDNTLAGILNGLGDKYSKYVLNLNGHSHDYERFVPIHGVVHITTGGGGSTLETPWTTTSPNTAYRAMHLEHVRIDVSSSALQVQAICGPATSNDDITCTPGSVIDSVSIPARNGSTDSPPAAALTVAPSSGTVPLAVTADASASTDTDATPIASYKFDFGDGTTSGPQTSSTATHTYTAAGTYTVTLTVTDTAGLSATTTATVAAGTSPPPDAPPVARLSVTPLSGAAPLAITANASASTDTDATPITSYTFDFGDGTTTGVQAPSTAPHTYMTPGIYTVTVTVADTAGLSATATATVNVGTASTNLVGNPGFETSTSGWNNAGRTGTTLSRVSGGHSGGWAALIYNGGTGSVECTLNDSPNWVTTTVPGAYTGSLWVRSDTPGATLSLKFREYKGSTLMGSNSAKITLTTTWQQVSVTYTPLAAGASTLDFNAYVSSAPPGTGFYADDASITVS